MIIAGLQKITLIDYPGKLACTVFLPGCNFRCPWCYSSELVLPERIKKQPKIEEKEFFDFLKERIGMIEGVVLCGGEPTIHKDLPKFAEKIKDLGFLVKLDTNGSNPKMLENLISEKLIDYVAMDIKAPLVGLDFQFPTFKSKLNSNSQISKYEKATGIKVNLENIKKSIDILKNSKIDYEFRTTIVPTIHQREDFLEIAKWLGGPEVKYYLQNFLPEKTLNSEFEKIKPYSDEYIKEIVKEISSYFKICQVR